MPHFDSRNLIHYRVNPEGQIVEFFLSPLPYPFSFSPAFPHFSEKKSIIATDLEDTLAKLSRHYKICDWDEPITKKEDITSANTETIIAKINQHYRAYIASAMENLIARYASAQRWAPVLKSPLSPKSVSQLSNVQLLFQKNAFIQELKEHLTANKKPIEQFLKKYDILQDINAFNATFDLNRRRENSIQETKHLLTDLKALNTLKAFFENIQIPAYHEQLRAMFETEEAEKKQAAAKKKQEKEPDIFKTLEKSSGAAACNKKDSTESKKLEKQRHSAQIQLNLAEQALARGDINQTLIYLSKAGSLGHPEAAEKALNIANNFLLEGEMESATLQTYASGYSVGILGEQFQTLDKKTKTALCFYRVAAELGNKVAMNNLAALLFKQKQCKEALELYKTASAPPNSHLSAALNLGQIYKEGINEAGIPKNVPEAIRYFKIAADGGISRAALSLYYLLRAKRNHQEEAVDYLLQAASGTDNREIQNDARDELTRLEKGISNKATVESIGKLGALAGNAAADNTTIETSDIKAAAADFEVTL
jgi:TPR repeat protein